MTTDTCIEAVDAPWEASMRYGDMAHVAMMAGALTEASRLARLAAAFAAQAVEIERCEATDNKKS